MRNSIRKDVDFVGRRPWQTEYDAGHEMLQTPQLVGNLVKRPLNARCESAHATVCSEFTP
jgi:hypothetical protein